MKPFALGLGMAFLTAIIHVVGLLILLYWQTRQWPKIEADFGPRRNLPAFLILFGGIFGLHLVEVGLWAGLYFWGNYLPNFETCFYFSGTTYTTVGYGDVLLPQAWRILSVMESLTGVLMMGWSTAFFFTTVIRLLELRIHRWQHINPGAPSPSSAQGKESENEEI